MAIQRGSNIPIISQQKRAAIVNNALAASVLIRIHSEIEDIQKELSTATVSYCNARLDALRAAIIPPPRKPQRSARSRQKDKGEE